MRKKLIVYPAAFLAVVGSACTASALGPKEGISGKVTSRPCPYECKTAGIPKMDGRGHKLCASWRDPATNICYVEDRRRGPGSPALRDNRAGNTTVIRQCNEMKNIPRPHIEVRPVSAPANIALNANKERVHVSIEGPCLLTSTGLYEHNQLVDKIPVVTTPDKKKYEYEVNVRTNREPEIRAYTTRGEPEIFALRR